MKSTNHPDEVKKIHSIYERMIGVLLFQKPLDDLENIIDQHFVGYGTAAHEFFQSLNEVEQMAQLQANQLQKTKVKMDRKLLQEKFVSKGLGYLIIEEVHSTIVADGHQFVMRVSTLLEKVKGRWKVAHFHGSTPDTNVDANEALPVAGLRKKNRELEEKIKARTRDLEIEAALERVRSEAMAMQTPDELTRVVDVLRAEMGKLGQQGIQASAINFYPDNQETFELWYAYRPASKKKDVVATGKATLPLKSTSLARKMKRLYLTAESEYLIHPKGKALQEWYDMLIAEIPGIAKQLDAERPKSIYWYFTDFSGGSFALTSVQKPTKESMQLQRKATAVFDLAYRRFLDLKRAEAQAREAQIESALERVRSRSLAMHQSAEIQEVVNTVFKEMKSLEMSMNVTSIFVLRSGKLPWEQWVASADTDYAQFFELPKLKHPVSKDLEKAIKKGSPFYTKRYTKKQKEAWFNYAFENTDYRKIPKKRKQYLLSSPWYEISFGLAKYTGIQIAKYEGESFSDDENSVLLRFTKVFEQAYVRFLDLQKAEAQAHEAQIEAALERVRSRSLAMHNSDELAEVVSVIYQQVAKFGLANWGCNIQIMDEDTEKIMIWLSDNPGAVLPRCFTFPAKGHPQIVKQWENWQKKIPTSVISLKGAAKKSYDDHVFNSTDFRHFSEEMKKGIRALHEVHFSFAWMKYGFIVSIHDSQPLDQDQFAILTRFARVFEQCYTRFLDLQKAEAQAREAQIQLALERVRSSALAMHESDALSDTIQVLFEQMAELGVRPVNTYLVLYDLDNNQFHFRMTGKQGGSTPHEMVISFDDLTPFKSARKDWESGEPVIEAAYEGDNRKDWLQLFKPINRRLPMEARLGLRDFPKGIYSTSGRHEFGSLGITHKRRATNEEKQLLVRFAYEFEVAYKRFLDLKKAEKQVREAQIEAALERVRSKSMAMQKSDDLAGVISVVFKQLVALGFDAPACGLNLFDENDGMEMWISGFGDEIYPESFHIQYFDHPYYNHQLTAWKNGKEYDVLAFEGKLKKSYDKQTFLNPDFFDLPHHILEEFLAKSKVISCAAFMRHGMLEIISEEVISQDEAATLSRFAKVFEQTYTRFLDLQKAEAQAREAQIEAALERVRTQTMAMHTSQDVGNTMVVLFDELLKLGIKADRNGILIMKEDVSAELWTAKPIRNGEVELIFWKLDMTFHQMGKDAFDDWQNHNPITEYTLEGEDLLDYYKGINAAIDGPERFEMNSLPARQYASIYHFAEGSIYIFSAQTIPEEHSNILHRFASVFGQTYRRYLDLQKAEEQAREAQIEAALERVRSRSLAMHHSSELSAVVDTLLQEFTNLEFTLTFCIINLIDEQDMSNTVWAANPETGKDPESYYMKFEDYPFHHAMWDAWKAQKKRFIYTIEGEEKKEYDQYLYSETEFRRFPEHVQKANKALTRYVAGFTFFKHSGLQTVSEDKVSEDDLDILERFGRVFEQAYTRFLDLQKAEAQAREAQIEAAMERVRSQAMAMHQSEDLQRVVQVIYDQIKDLGFAIDSAQFDIFEQDSDDIHGWIATENYQYAQRIRTPYFQNPITDAYKAAKAKKPTTYNLSFSKTNSDSYWRHVFKHTDLSKLPAKRKKYLLSRAGINQMGAVLENLSLSINNYQGKHYAEEQTLTIKRFAEAFQQSYTRFLDLQKAETQAREAQIEAALERVRAATLAMHQSLRLGEVVKVLLEAILRL